MNKAQSDISKLRTAEEEAKQYYKASYLSMEQKSSSLKQQTQEAIQKVAHLEAYQTHKKQKYREFLELIKQNEASIKNSKTQQLTQIQNLSYCQEKLAVVEK